MAWLYTYLWLNNGCLAIFATVLNCNRIYADNCANKANQTMTYFWTQFDQHWFHQINQAWSNPVFDVLMPVFRNPKTWIPLYIFIIGFSIYRYRKTAILLIALLAASAGTADFICVRVIKAYVKKSTAL